MTPVATTATGTGTASGTAAGRARRQYDSPLRQQRASETRDRIVSAGCDLLAESSIRDWRGLTMRAVAERAGVNERTVYRHFTNERGLRDAVMHRQEQQAGIDLTALRLDGVADVAARIVASIATHPLPARPELDPTLTEASERVRGALLRAVADETEGWSAGDQQVAAAMFDVLWGMSPYERLVADWGLDADQAVAGITWVIGLIEDAVRAGARPGSGTGAGAGA